MQQKSIGKQIWELIYPLFIYFGATFVVEGIVVMGYYMLHFQEMMEAAQSTQTMMEYALETSQVLLKYSVEMTAGAALLALPFLIWIKCVDDKKEKRAGWVQNRKAPLSQYVWIAGISIPLTVALNNLLILSDLARYSAAYQETADVLYTPSLLMQVVCLGIIVPITEEFVFRGLMYKRMRRSATARKAIVSSAVFFGIYHGNLIQMIYGIICGLLLAYLYEKYGSIKAPILAHILMNLTSVLLTDVDAFTWMFTRPMRMAVITVACATLASTVFLMIQKIEEEP